MNATKSVIFQVLIILFSIIITSCSKKLTKEDAVTSIRTQFKYPKALTESLDCDVNRPQGYNHLTQKGLITFRKQLQTTINGPYYWVDFTSDANQYLMSDYHGKYDNLTKKDIGKYMDVKVCSTDVSDVIIENKTEDGYLITFYIKYYEITPFGEYFTMVWHDYTTRESRKQQYYFSDKKKESPTNVKWGCIKDGNAMEIKTGKMVYNKEMKSWVVTNINITGWKDENGNVVACD